MNVITARLAAGLAVAAALVGAASAADAPVATASGDAGAPVASAGANDTDQLIAEYLKARPGPGAAGQPPEEPVLRDRAIHGEVGFGIGTHGYREAYGVATVPLGDSGSATVAVSDGRIGGRYGTFNSRSLALSLAFGDGAGRGPESGCGAALDGGRYVEPLWVTRMRRDHLARPLACGPAWDTPTACAPGREGRLAC